VGGDSFAPGKLFRHETFIPDARKDELLGRRAIRAGKRQGFDDGLIDFRSRPGLSAHHQHGRNISLQSQFLAGADCRSNSL